MSDAYGFVEFQDGTIKYCCYHGTSDVCDPKLFDNLDGMWDSDEFGWQTLKQCKESNHEPETVLIYSNYGQGFYWEGTACRKCGVIVEGLAPDGEESPFNGKDIPACKKYRTREEYLAAKKGVANVS